MIPTPRPHLASLRPVPHGSVSEAELARLGLSRAGVVDFSVNSHPFGPSPAALLAAQTAAWDRYPEDGAPGLRRELAARDGVAEETIVIGNGSAELIWLLALAFLGPGESVVAAGPTFGEYAHAARIAGAIVHEQRADPAQGFTPDLPALVARAAACRARMLFLCNPNNPTGSVVTPAAIGELAAGLPQTLVVLDEAYRQFMDEPAPTLPLLAYANVVLLRSLTKDYALAGLRLGYALAAPTIRAALEVVRPPWSVNAVAQAAGLASLRDTEHLARGRAEVRRARAYLTAALAGLGLRPAPAAANFVLVEVGDAGAVRAALLRHGLCVRDCASFGLPGHIRIGLRTLPECERLVAAMRAAGLGRAAEEERR